jgi:hypothetical protein
MGEPIFTLHQLVDSAPLATAARQGFPESEGGRRLEDIQQEIRRRAPDVHWPHADRDVAEQVGHMLDIPLRDILIRAWNDNRMFDRYLNPQKYRADDTIVLTLADHTLTSEHRPRIEITLDGREVGHVQFQIRLTLTLKGVILKIRGGHIQEFSAGTAKGHLTVSCEGLKLYEADTATFEFPNVVLTTEPVPIAPASTTSD